MRISPMGLILMALVGCQSTRSELTRTDASVVPPANQDAEPPLVVRAETVLPPSFVGRAMDGVPEGPLVIPESLLRESVVIRPRAEVRAGPGTQFQLTDVVLPQGTNVLIFAEVGVWRKVLVPTSGQKGWIHHQSMAPSKPTTAAVSLSASDLPTVLAVRQVDVARRFPSGEPQPVVIPKGTMFHALINEGEDALVWLLDTNSVVWLSRKDVQ